MAAELVPEDLLEKFNEGRCIFFIGAGVSTESGLISGNEFKQELGRKIKYPSSDATLAKVAQAFEDTIDRPGLVDQVKKHFAKNRTNIQGSYKMIADLCKQGNCTHIITTNYDSLLESALTEANCEFHRSKSDEEVVFSGAKKLHVVKFHGTVDDVKSIVITEADYRSFFRRNPILSNLLRGLLVERTFVFLGYSLEDPDFDQIYHDIAIALGDFQRLSYAVQPKPINYSDDDWQKFHVGPWSNRKIRILTGKAINFLNELHSRLDSPQTPNDEVKLYRETLIKDESISIEMGNIGLSVPIPLTLDVFSDSIVEIEVRIQEDGGNRSNWFGIRLRGVTSYFHSGYLIYLRSSGFLDVSSIEERPIIDNEIKTVDPKSDFVKLRVSIVGDEIKVWINEEKILDIKDKLVSWPGKVYFHTFGTKVTARNLKIYKVEQL